VIFIVSKEPESATLYAHKLLLVVVCYLGSDIYCFYVLLKRLKDIIYGRQQNRVRTKSG